MIKKLFYHSSLVLSLVGLASFASAQYPYRYFMGQLVLPEGGGAMPPPLSPQGGFTPFPGGPGPGGPPGIPGFGDGDIREAQRLCGQGQKKYPNIYNAHLTNICEEVQEMADGPDEQPSSEGITELEGVVQETLNSLQSVVYEGKKSAQRKQKSYVASVRKVLNRSLKQLARAKKMMEEEELVHGEREKMEEEMFTTVQSTRQQAMQKGKEMMEKGKQMAQERVQKEMDRAQKMMEGGGEFAQGGFPGGPGGFGGGFGPPGFGPSGFGGPGGSGGPGFDPSQMMNMMSRFGGPGGPGFPGGPGQFVGGFDHGGPGGFPGGFGPFGPGGPGGQGGFPGGPRPPGTYDDRGNLLAPANSPLAPFVPPSAPSMPTAPTESAPAAPAPAPTGANLLVSGFIEMMVGLLGLR